MRSTISCFLIGAILGLSGAAAQSPAPVVVVAAAADSSVPKPTVATPDDANSGAVLRALEAIRAANEETLQKQSATLSQLEEIEKNADQLRIFSRRS